MNDYTEKYIKEEDKSGHNDEVRPPRKKRVRIRSIDISKKRRRLTPIRVILVLLAAAIGGIIIGLMLGHILGKI